MSIEDKTFRINRLQSGQLLSVDDSVAVEEPLEIRIVFGPAENRKTRSLSVTMRTPGRDLELAAGFLISEGMLTKPGEIIAHRWTGPVAAGQTKSNTIEIELDPSVVFELSKLQRHFYMTSSCGVCGKSSLDAIRADNISSLVSELSVSSALICKFPESIRQQQAMFQQTGGIHAAGLMTPAGDLIAIAEDVGRHNALDKLIGGQFLIGHFPLTATILVLSGRASFELMQKALLASVPIVVAVGAPSSLAIELAREFGITLIGFVSKERFNVYSNPDRITF